MSFSGLKVLVAFSPELNRDMIFTNEGIKSLSALDACEEQILRALQKDGWTIVTKPFAIRTNNHTVYADCLLERKQTGQNEQVIILEVKCFSNSQADLQEFYIAVGQYQFYRAAVAANQSKTAVFLAIPNQAYIRLTRDNAVNIAIKQGSIKLVVIDIVIEEVVAWFR